LKASALEEFDKFLVKKHAFLLAILAIAIFDCLVESVSLFVYVIRVFYFWSPWDCGF
jgi:hypothetical protein